MPAPEPIPQPEPEPDPVPPPAARRRLGRRVVAVAGLVGAILACAAGGIVLGSVVSSAGDNDPAPTATTVRTAPTAPARTTTTAPAGAGPSVPLASASDYDPDGDRAEHADLLPLAIDGDPSTAWSTEDYRVLAKPGVGLYVDPRDPVSPTRVTLRTPTPGFSVEIYGSAAPQAPSTLAGWTKLGDRVGVKRTQGIPLDAAGRRYRHVLVWITTLPTAGGAAKLSDVVLRG